MSLYPYIIYVSQLDENNECFAVIQLSRVVAQEVKLKLVNKDYNINEYEIIPQTHLEHIYD